MYNIILVHIGDVFYNYINDCIEQLLIYNNLNIYLLISDTHKNKITHNINIILLEDIIKSEEHLLFNKITKLDISFRNGFWKHASERFYYIYDFVKYLDLKNIIHIENDINLYFDVKNYIKIFEDNYNIAATFDNDNRCIPGIVYFKNQEFLSKMIKYIMNNQYKNDMEILSDYRLVTSDMDFLPIIYPNYSCKNNVYVKDYNIFAKNFYKFNSIFDAACIGQFLGGVDPRNITGNSVGFVNESCVFDPSKLNIYWKNIYGNKEPYIILNDMEIKINNLHMHCKNLKKFK